MLHIPLDDEGEDAYPSLTDFHDHEPQLEFDDTEVTALKEGVISKFWNCLALRIFRNDLNLIFTNLLSFIRFSQL